MSGFTKLFESILDSTIWRESKETRLVWVTMLAMANIDGEVDSSLPGLADRAKVSPEECQKALGVLLAPDKWSRSKEHEGRRIEEIDGGWKLLNHAKYRDKQSPEEIKEKARLRQERWRERHPDKKPKSKRKNGRDFSGSVGGPSFIAQKIHGDTGVMPMNHEDETGKNAATYDIHADRSTDPTGDDESHPIDQS